MATLQKRNDSFRILFLHHGKRYTFTLGQVPQAIAEAKVSKVDEILALLRGGYISMPPAVDIVTFMEHDGKVSEESPVERDHITLGKLRDEYLRIHEDALEETTISGMEIHFKHLVSTLGERFPLNSLTLAQLQEHASRRQKMKGIKGKISPATIRKELVTLRTAWNWGVHMGFLTGRFPALKRVKMPKQDDKPPFQTRAEIERRIARGSLDQKEIDDLWDSLYLRPEEIAELLAFVKLHAFQPWVYPLICTAAFTGARRSELLRLGVHDVDFGGDSITIHERKREHDKRTTRRVSLTPFLKTVLQEWIDVRHDGPVLFCQNAQVMRSKTKRTGPTAVTRDEAHNHFKQTLADSKWAVVKGFHALRHSFISCLASAGVDQRIIDDFVGHQTEQQRRRYRHIFPNVKQDAITSAFSSVEAASLPGERAQPPRAK